MKLMRNSCICFALVLVFAGCDVDQRIEPATCQVRGQVLLDGQAVPGVKVVFVPQQIKAFENSENRIASGISDDRGEFVLEVDSRESKQICHDRYRVIVSKIVDGKELFHESYNESSLLVVVVDEQEAIQRPVLELMKTGTF